MSKEIIALLVILALILLSIILILICGYYKLRIGVYPDIEMFYEYALSYGSGFGGVPIAKFGTIWVYVMLFSGIYGSIFFDQSGQLNFKSYSAIVFSSLGIILSLATYFIGRAHPSNITAVMPIICMVIIVNLLIRKHNKLPNIPLLIIGFPFIFISLSGGLVQPSSLENLAKMKSLSSDIQLRLHPSDNNLSALISEAQISPEDYVAYYGFNAAMPTYVDNGTVKTYEKSWLFNPFQLLEDPISLKRREEIAIRSLSNRWQNEGYVIQAKGQFEDRFSDWKKIISKYYLLDTKFENKDYVIIHLIKR